MTFAQAMRKNPRAVIEAFTYDIQDVLDEASVGSLDNENELAQLFIAVSETHEGRGLLETLLESDLEEWIETVELDSDESESD